MTGGSGWVGVAAVSIAPFRRTAGYVVECVLEWSDVNRFLRSAAAPTAVTVAAVGRCGALCTPTVSEWSDDPTGRQRTSYCEVR